MRKGTAAAILILIALLARPQIILAQTTNGPVRGSWDSLKVIPPGDELIVNLKSGQGRRGRLISVTDVALTLDHDQKIAEIDRGEIVKVHRLISRSAKRSTLIGLGIGGAVGGLGGGVGAASGRGERGEYGWSVLIVGAIGIGVGSLVGYIIGSRKHRVLVYET